MSQLEEDYPGEIVHLEWQFVQMLATSGAADRAGYYGINYSPSVVFDGVDEIPGWTSDTYSSYEAILANHRAALSRLTVNAEASFDEATRSGAVTVRVEVAPGETIADGSSLRIRCAIYENDIDFLGTVWSFIGRAIVLDAPLTISASGELQVEAATFHLDDPNPPVGALPWGPASNFHAIAFVQRDDTSEILNTSRATTGGVSIAHSSWGRVKAAYR